MGTSENKIISDIVTAKVREGISVTQFPIQLNSHVLKIYVKDNKTPVVVTCENTQLQ